VGLDATGDPVFCRIWTHLGCPAISVPGLHGPAGLPLGVQVVAPPGQDGAALTAARWLSRQLAAPERA
jgi:Asp-tRNA(Asn)/Glu-tRNA(Gln) amidotransferase A subunit family amidase